MTPEEMKQALIEAQQKRIAEAGEAFKAAVLQIEQQYKVGIIPQIVLKPGSVEAAWFIAPTE